MVEIIQQQNLQDRIKLSYTPIGTNCATTMGLYGGEIEELVKRFVSEAINPMYYYNYEKMIILGNLSYNDEERIVSSLKEKVNSILRKGLYGSHFREGNNWLHYKKDNADHKAEYRIYLNVDERFLPDVFSMFFKSLKNTNLDGMKCNISHDSRKDSLVFYFNENMNRNDLEAVINTIKEIRYKHGKTVFRHFDIIQPWSKYLVDKEKCFGMITYWPVPSSIGDVSFSFEKGIGTSELDGAGSTPNDLTSAFYKSIHKLKEEFNLDYEEIVNIVLNSKIIVRGAELPEFKGKEFTLKDYLLKVREKLDKLN